MNTKFQFWGLAMLAALILGVFAAACTDDKTESQVTLHYMDIGDIGPSMHYTTNPPTYKGDKPSDFAVEGVKFNGEFYSDADGCFSADPTTGAIVIMNTNMLQTGTYSLSIACTAGGQRCFFADIMKVRMLSATPLEVEVSPSVLEIDYDGAKLSKLTAQIAPKDEAVTISVYELAQEEGKEYFTVSKTGQIGINAAYKDEILPGVYTPGLKLTSLAGSATYENTFTVKITSKPLEVTYKPVQGRSEYNMAFTSSVPTVKGSADEGLQWAISSVDPQTDRFAIDPATGVISLAVDNGLPIDGVYSFDLTVSNQYGSTDFSDSYSVKIVAFITPIDPATFAYDAAETTEACAFSVSKKAGFVGDEVSFELGTLPAALAGQLAIDDETGDISALKGNTIPVGDYQIPVNVTNTKGTATATLSLKVKANPNMFHKFGYGNNLGLDAESNFDQFRWAGDGSTNLAVTIPLANGYNDFNGRKPVFKFEVILDWALQNATNAAQNYVDENGNVNLFMRGNRWGQIGYVRVTATLGEGETAVSRSTIVFVMLRKAADSDLIEFTPFVHRINSRNGGLTGIRPTFGPGVDQSKVMMSWRQNCFFYENLAVGQTPVGGKLEAGQAARTIGKIWWSYDPSGTFNPSNRMPFSYYDSSGAKDDANMARKLGYFDPNNGSQIYIAPNKWFNEGQPVSGILTFQASYSTTANNNDLGGTSKLMGCAIWFDEKY